MCIAVQLGVDGQTACTQRNNAKGCARGKLVDHIYRYIQSEDSQISCTDCFSNATDHSTDVVLDPAHTAWSELPQIDRYSHHEQDNLLVGRAATLLGEANTEHK